MPTNKALRLVILLYAQPLICVTAISISSSPPDVEARDTKPCFAGDYIQVQCRYFLLVGLRRYPFRFSSSLAVLVLTELPTLHSFQMSKSLTPGDAVQALRSRLAVYCCLTEKVFRPLIVLSSEE